MFEMRLSNVISMLVDEYLKNVKPVIVRYDSKSVTKRGICIEVKLDADDYKKNKKISENYYILFCGNVSVWYAKTVDKYERYACFPSEVPVKNWINTSNHDSCWRDDGLNFLTQIYFDYCSRINPDKAPKDVDTSAHLGLGSPVQYVTIQYKKEKDYKREIINVILNSNDSKEYFCINKNKLTVGQKLKHKLLGIVIFSDQAKKLEDKNSDNRSLYVEYNNEIQEITLNLIKII